MTAAKPLARYGAIEGRARERLPPPKLHHYPGRNPGVLTWVNRLTKIRLPERDLFGHIVSRWQVIRTSNAYRFHDPEGTGDGASDCTSKNPPRPMIQEIHSLVPLHTRTRIVVLHPHQSLDEALIRLGKATGADIETHP